LGFTVASSLEGYFFIYIGIYSTKNKNILVVTAKTTAPWCSHVLTNHSTKRALTGLTSEIERDPVLSGRYGRS
jgi:hypothetical protein